MIAVEERLTAVSPIGYAPELTREMCVDLIEYIIIGDCPSDKSVPRNIQNYYKFLDEGYSGDIRLNLGLMGN